MHDIGASRYDDDADAYFRVQAFEDGWLKSDPHPPGNGLGLWAWYRANGIVPPENLERTIRRHEVTNWEWANECE